MQTRLIGCTSYFSKAQLEASNPSRREGIDAVAEARWRSTTSKVVKAAIKKLKLPDWVYETASNYINRFFLTRSISKNDRHLVVGGAILLASKVQESPRSVQDVAYVLLQLKNANKQKPQLGPDQTTLEQSMEGVVMAEQAMLCSLNFNLNVESHVSLARRFLEPLDLWAKANPPLEEVEANQLKLALYSTVMFFLNDSALTNLSLQYPNYKIAPVTLVMAAKRIVAARYSGKEVPAALQRVLALANDATWFESKGLTLETAADIEAQINELYATAPAQPAAQRQQQAQSQQPANQAAQPQQQAQQQAATGTAETGAGASALTHDEGAEEGELAPSASDRQPANDTKPAVESASVLVMESFALGPSAASTAVPSGITSLAAARDASPSGLPAAAVAAGPSHYGQPTSSAAVGPADAAAAAGTPPLPPSQTPCHPSQHQQHRGKRVSDGDDFSDQQATSELHVAPEPHAETGAADDHEQAGGCRDFPGPEASATENNSPNGLTNGNASGSGCVHAEGQPEVCSGHDAPCQQLPPSSQPQSPVANGDTKANEILAAANDKPRAKRGRSETVGDECSDGVASQLAPLGKVRRLEEVGLVAMLH